VKIQKRYLLLPLLLVVFGYLFYSTYQEVKHQRVEEFNAQQKLMAVQAAKGIQGFFDHYKRQLQFLSRIPEVIETDARGKAIMRTFFENNSVELLAITRMDTLGRILYTFPDETAIGSDISYQPHVKELLATRQPVVSDVFQAVQGYQTVACLIPVFQDGTFRGSLTALVSFNLLAKNYVENINIGEDGYAWMISEKGIELYCPITEHIGSSIFESFRDFPSNLDMVKRMMIGEEGSTTYRYNRIRGQTVKVLTKQAVYYPIDLGNTFWSIAVATPENEIHGVISGFRNRLVIIFFAAMAGVILYYHSIIKAWSILREEKKRKIAEAALRASEATLKEYVDHAPYGIFVVDRNGMYTDVNPAACELTGYSRDELIGRNQMSVIPLDSRTAAQAHFAGVFADNVSTADLPYLNKGGRRRDWTITTVKVSENRFLAFAYDITKRIETEFEIKRNLQEKEVMLREIHHRVKNNLTVITSLLNMQSQEIKSHDQALDAFNESVDRIRSMALVHEQLYESNDFSGIDFEAYVKQLTDELLYIYHDDKKIDIQYAIEPVDLNIITAVPCGLMVNELITNALKHAFNGRSEGSISVECRYLDSGRVILAVHDNGVGLPHALDPTHTETLGMKLIMLLSKQIQGDVSFNCDQGTRVQIQFPGST
jgi:PAS domain S-box-containing protein